MANSYKKRPFRVIMLRFAVYFLCFFLAAAGVVVYKGMQDNVFKADVAVVLGNEVYADGTCSPRLAARLDSAALLVKSGLVDKVIVSGGVGRSGYSEPKAMAQYLARSGVDKNIIIEDESGVNTRATAVFTGNYMKENGLNSVIAVSQYFHIPRTCLALKGEGISNVGSVHADYIVAEDVFSIGREVIAFFAYASGMK